MKLRPGKIALAAVTAEIFGLLSLVVLVVVFKPASDDAAVQTFAEHLGTWVGPITGFVFCCLGGFWVAKGSEHPIGNGFAMGCAGVVLDVLSGLGFGAHFEWLLVFSNAGRVAGGTLGGWLTQLPRESGQHGNSV